MKKAPIPLDEDKRLSDLRRYLVLDTPYEPCFDDITQLAATVCGTQTALVSLIDSDRQWFKSRFGISATETPRDVSYCGHAIMDDEIFIVEDPQNDERFCDNPLTLEMPIGFYAGVPLVTPNKSRIGTLCVIHPEKKVLNQEQKAVLKSLASHVIALLELGLKNEELLKRSAELETYARGLDSYAKVVRTDFEGKITYVNDLFCQSSGYSREELIGNDLRLLNSGHHPKNFFQDLWDTILQGKVWRGEIKNKTKSGELQWLDTIISPLFSSKGNIEAFLSIRYDITERKLTEERLRESELRHRLLFDQSVDAVMITSPPHWKFTSANPATAKLFGVSSPEDMLSLGPWDVSPEFQPDGEASAVKAAREIGVAMEKGSNYFEWMHCKIDGTPMPCTVLLSRITQDEITYLQATVRDISEQKQAERDLLESQRKLEVTNRQLNEAQSIAKVGSWYFDLRTKELVWTEEHYKIFEIESPQPLDVLFNLYRERVHPEDLPKVDYLVDRCMKYGEDYFHDHRVLLDGGSRIKYVQGIGKVHKGVDGTPLFASGTCRDRTAEVEIESKLELERAKTMHNAKLASIGRLAAGVGHEINNPLAIISGHISLAEYIEKASPNPNDEVLDAFKKMRSAVTRIDHIVKGLRTFARSDENQIGEFSPYELVAETTEMLKELYKRENIKVSLTGEKKEAFIFGNRGRIQQVLVNLMANARDASEGKPERKVDVEISSDKDFVKLVVADNGKGIPPEIRERIFDPFFTTKDVNKGTGIGLSIVTTIVKEHDGSIDLETEVGGGSRFIIHLPIRTTPSLKRAPAEIKKVEESASTTKCRVLIVDDEPDLGKVLKDVLLKTCRKVVYAQSAEEALKFLEVETFDLIISDIMMPKVDGFEFFNQIRDKKLSPSPKFLFITGGVEMDEEQSRIVENEADGFIPKPFNINSVIEKINSLFSAP